MKYLLIADKGKNGQELLDRIAAFLWDNGNSVYTRNRFQTEADYRNMVESCDGFVVVSTGGCPAKSCQDQDFYPEGLEFGKSSTKKIALVFTIDGVYCNAIPSPYKIFHFESLSQHELTRFFHWCGKLNLFTKYPLSASSSYFLFL